MPFVGQTRAPADSLAFIRAARRQPEENRGVQLAIVRDERIIGVAGFHGIDWTRRSTSIGYWLAADAAGGGHDDAGGRARCSTTPSSSWEPGAGRDPRRRRQPRSRAIPERLGFREEGVLRGGRADRHARDRPRRLRDDGARVEASARRGQAARRQVA